LIERDMMNELMRAATDSVYQKELLHLYNLDEITVAESPPEYGRKVGNGVD
jgi:hypothetical protein